jgi:hypothetical protein
MANTYLTRTGVTPTISNKYTFSCWVKRGSIGTTETIFRTYSDSNNSAQLIFDSDDSFAFQDIIGGTTVTNLKPSNLFRDTGAWMNIIVQVDYTQAVAADRAKIFINGAEVSYSATTVQSEGGASMLNTANNNALGSNRSNSSHYFTGSMSHVNFIDGTAYPATAFGSVDATSGIWKINTAPSVTYGNNGFFTLRDGNTITDSSPNSNNFSLGGGTLTKTEDCPDNNFATFNPLDNYFPSGTFKNGNTTVNTGNNYAYPQATIYVNTGKWYWEVKAISKVSGGDEYMIGIQGRSATAINQPAQSNNGITVYGTDGDTYGFGGTATTYAAAYTAGDIIGVALDCDNNKLYFSKNGAWSTGAGAWGSTTFNASTGALTITDPNDVPQGGYSPVAGAYTSVSHELSYNFGNGHFGTTAVTTNSGNGYAGTEGKSIFNYQPPTGYTALSTKGLNL